MKRKREIKAVMAVIMEDLGFYQLPFAAKILSLRDISWVRSISGNLSINQRSLNLMSRETLIKIWEKVHG